MLDLRRYSYFLACLLVFSSCGNKVKQRPAASTTTGVGYAEHFDLQQMDNYTLVTLKGRKNSQDTTALFILYKEKEPDLNFNQKTFKVRIPCNRIVALSSIYASMFTELGCVNNLIAIDNADYVCNSRLIQKHKDGELIEVGKGPEPDLEKIMALKPDILLTFGMGKPEEETKPQVIESGIPYALVVDHLEKTPLARAEWIRFFAAFVDQGKTADSIFAEVEKSYVQLRDSMLFTGNRPLVLTELNYGETWYVPGGNSFMACLLKDAGALYPWSDNAQSGSLPLSFEEVYLKAGQADYWINLSMACRKSDMINQEARYMEFKAFKNGNLYNNNKRVNSKGYSEYWESAMYHPERVLKDLVTIFHQNEVQEKELYYYRKLN